MFLEVRAAIYARISKDQAGDELGVQRQLKDARALCERNGWESAGEYVDDNRSAFNGKGRPAWERLLVDAGDGRFDAVVAWHDDRLWRDVVEQQTVFAILAGYGVGTVACVRSRTYSTHSDDDAFLSGIQALVAQKESADKRRRLRRKHEELAQAGKSSGGGRAFGWQADKIELDPAEAALIREAAGRVLTGASVRSIAKEWNERGIPTVTGARWSSTVLRRMLTAWRTCGIREHHGEPTAEAVWRPILDRPTVERLRRLLLDPDRRVNQRARKYLLAGLVVCDRCGHKMVARPRDDGARCYVCSSDPNHNGGAGCGRMKALAQTLEDHVVAEALALIDNPGVAEALRAAQADENADAYRTIDEITAKLTDLGMDYDDGKVPRGEYEERRVRLQQRLDRARAAVKVDDRAALLGPYAGHLAETWGDLGFDAQRAVLLAAVEQVTVRPAVRGRNRFDPDRFDVATTLDAVASAHPAGEAAAQAIAAAVRNA